MLIIPKRIQVIGSPGGGKTTFARELQAISGHPLVHLDRLNWSDGWVSVGEQTLYERLSVALAAPTFIMDGHYADTLPLRMQYTDCVIWLDYPTVVNLIGVLRRVLSHLGRPRAEMPSGCPERLDFAFLRYVCRFRRQQNKRTEALLARHPEVLVFRIRSRAQARDLLRRWTKR